MLVRLSLALTTFLPLISAFSCSLQASSIPYDLNPLSGLRQVSKDTPTPPTTSEAKVLMDLCSSEGIGSEDGTNEEDQCPPNTRVCLKLLNHKPSSSDPDRVTAVIPLWPADIPEEDVFTTPMGKNGVEGLKVYVQGGEYAGTRQHLNLTLLCSASATNPEPTFISYTSGLLSLEWATPDACPRTADSPVPDSGSGGSGGGVFGFVRFVFWLLIFALIVYFIGGIFYNHQQYSARGWDLVPHRDFWREVPALISDLFGHLFANVRGSGGGRGGYSSLG